MLFRSVERQQQEEAQSKAQVVVPEPDNLASAVWDTTSAPQPGGINPTLVAQDGGQCFLSPVYEAISNSFLTGALDWSADTGPAGPTDWSADQGTSGWGADGGDSGW